MKKLIILLCVFAGADAHAQKLYLSVNAGFGFPVGRADHFSGPTIKNGSGGDVHLESEFYSLGKGPSIQADLGYMIRENFGLQLGVSYLYGLKSTTEDNHPTSLDKGEIRGNLLMLSPALVMYFPLSETSKLYSRIGVVFGSGNVFVDQEDESSGTDFTIKFNNGVSTGIQGAMGFEMRTGSRLGIFGEVSMLNLSYAPTHAEFIKFEENGVDKLPAMPVSQKEYELSDEATGNTNGNANEPSKYARFYFPVQNIGVHAGVRIFIR